MSLSPGTRLGAYEIVGIIGSGGMGEVYRARDTRLGRDVAIKVLPALLAADPDALARFEREMTTLAALSHPHILAIHHVGREGTTAYAVTELLDGESVADIATRGPVSIRKALDYGVQMARALATAHERGIVHRDLKPGNVFVTADGQIKVLDFGLAKALGADRAGATAEATMTGTTPGMVMGTVGYMAPEQARGLAVDHRADIFAFGCVMYELVSGRRAFQRDSAADTLSAILKEDPPPLSTANVAVPPALERVIQRCLEKHPAERFQSARDLAFALDGLSSGSGGGSAISGPVQARAGRRWPRVAAGAAAIAALAAMFLLGRALAPTATGETITVKRLTFERGVIRTARFAPDAETIVYGAAWNGAPLKVFLGRTDTAESKRLDLPDADVHAVSASGEMALSLGRHYPTSWTPDGTLGRGRLFSSSVREVLEHVREADFLPNDALAIVRRVDGRDRLEVPQGTVVFDTPGYISHMRVSPDGRRVGFLEHPLYGDNRGHVAVYENGKARRLTVGTRSGSPAASIVDVKSGKRTDLALPELHGRAWSARRYMPTHASPDGSLLAIGADDGKALAWKLPGGGPARELASLGPNEVFAGWSAHPSRIFVVAWNGPKARVDTLDVSTGARTFVREITIEDPAGMLMAMPDLFLSADAHSYAYGYTRMLSTLSVVTGLR